MGTKLIRHKRFIICIVAIVLLVVFLLLNSYYGIVFAGEKQPSSTRTPRDYYEFNELSKKFESVSGVDLSTMLSERGVTISEYSGGTIDRGSSLLASALTPKSARWFYSFGGLEYDGTSFSVFINLNGMLKDGRSSFYENAIPPGGFRQKYPAEDSMVIFYTSEENETLTAWGAEICLAIIGMLQK